MSFILWNQILLWIALLITRLLSLLLIQSLVCTWWHMIANFTTSWAIHISHTKNWSDFISEYNVKISLFHRLLCISFSSFCHLILFIWLHFFFSFFLLFCLICLVSFVYFCHYARAYTIDLFSIFYMESLFVNLKYYSVSILFWYLPNSFSVVFE